MISMPIHVINVKQHTDRWEKVRLELQKTGHQISWDQVHRLDAVFGKDLTKQQLKANATLSARLFCTPAMIGCYMSHRKFWEIVAESDNEPYQLVFEDDVLLTDEFGKNLQSIINELDNHRETKEEWDALLLGGFGCVHPDGKYGILQRIMAFFWGGTRKARKVTEHCHVPHRALGAHAYVLSKRGARKLLEHEWKVMHHVDVVMWGMQELKIYITVPLLAYQDFENSTLGAATKLESMIYSWARGTIDSYTKVSIQWFLHEPACKIPFWGIALTPGRVQLLSSVLVTLGVAVQIHYQVGIGMWIWVIGVVLPFLPPFFSYRLPRLLR